MNNQENTDYKITYENVYNYNNFSEYIIILFIILLLIFILIIYKKFN